MRTLLISDIHGELEMFEELLERVNYQPDEDELVLLGDYIDRGPSPSGVLDKIIDLKKAGAQVLMGNHEQIMLDVFEKENKYDWDFWLHTAGGVETMASYGFSAQQLEQAGDLNHFSLQPFFTDKIIEHLEFIRHLDTIIEKEHYIFVHAGVDPTLPLAKNTTKDFLWIRDEFHRDYAGDKTVVFGHTPTPRLHRERGKSDIYFGENRIIGIDGGAVFGGQLNCLELPSQKVVSVQNKQISYRQK
ncbi:metallophosphoesterase [Kurthia sibirica]|uniref:Serine/threonine protein phosphatase n=1 Tax=Kurthia sibirica TaxID=202750 RepID=A0A2U3AI28_9BACL|nr:metallophosphoesterase [Kurthia sibirica]PWI24144.1 serine/threonine protein phosphatase [Kurthia sibirica]GEK34667.1 serine/threonine protein phosphatase [Kurthia sibirica]